MGKRQSSELCIQEKRRRSMRLLEKKRSWSDLPEELVEVIMSKLLFTDQICVRAVCKMWRSIRRVKPAKQIPWLLIWHHESMASCKLYDPVYKKVFTVNNTCLRDLPNSNTKVRASKDGWLLISYRLCELKSLFLLYSPFTNERFDFPGMDHTDEIDITYTAMFSSSPSSSDCIIFVMGNEYNHAMIVIRTCRLGETTWTTNRYINNHFGSFAFARYPAANTAYINGIFYYANNYGTLGIFNVAQQTWNVMERPTDQTSEIHHLVVHDIHHLVVHDGRLLLVSHNSSNNPEVFFRLDIAQNCWVKLDNLGDLVIFLGNDTSLVSSSATKKKIADRIYYSHMGSKFKFYSMKSGCIRYDCRIYGYYSQLRKLCTPPRKLYAEYGYSRFTWFEPPTN